MESVVAVVVAAGEGTRFGGTIPKALRELGDRPLVAWAVAGLLAGEVARVVVVAPEAYVASVRSILAHDDAVAGAEVRVVAGGHDRQASVRRGLDALGPEASSEAVVLVHDAARPLAPVDVVTRVTAAVRSGALAVTPVVAVTDTIRQVSDHGDQESSVLVDRDLLRAVQTPQGFRFSALYEAHQLALRTQVDVTDDVAACELAGHPITLVEGSALSFKITHPLDLVVAEALLSHRPGL